MAGNMPEAADWGSLPADLLVLVFNSPALTGNDTPWPLSLSQAAALLAALSPNKHWRRVALEDVSGGNRQACWLAALSKWAVVGDLPGCSVAPHQLPRSMRRPPSVQHPQLHLRLCLHRRADLDSPLLARLRCCRLVLLPGAAAEGCKTHLRSLLLGGPLQRTSGGTLTELLGLPPISWGGKLLQAFPRLTSVGLAVSSSSGMRVVPARLQASWVAQLRRLQLTSRTITLHLSSWPEELAAPGVGTRSVLQRVLAAMAPLMDGTAIQELELSVKYLRAALLPAIGGGKARHSAPCPTCDVLGPAESTFMRSHSTATRGDLTLTFEGGCGGTAYLTLRRVAASSQPAGVDA